MRTRNRDKRAAAIAGMLSTTNAKHVEAVHQPRETLASFTREYDRQEREAAERKKEAEEKPIREAQAAFSRTLVKLRAAQAENLFINRSEELAAKCSPVPDHVPGTVEEIRQQIKDAFESLPQELSREGMTLHACGLEKVKKIAQLNPTIDIRQPANWRAIFDHANELGALKADDVTVPTPQPEPVKPPEHSDARTMDDLLAVDAGTQEGQRAAREIADDLYASEVAPLYQEWIDLIYRTFNHVVNRKDADLIAEWFATNNKSWLRHESYNECRRYLVSIHHWPDSMLLPHERSLLEIETLPRLPGESDFSYRRRAQALAR